MRLCVCVRVCVYVCVMSNRWSRELHNLYIIFLCIAVHFTHTCLTTQNDENNLGHRPRREKPQERLSEKSGAAIMQILYSRVFLISQQLSNSSLWHWATQCQQWSIPVVVTSGGIKHGNKTTNIHSLRTLQMFPSEGDVLYIPYEFLEPALVGTNDTRRIIIV